MDFPRIAILGSAPLIMISAFAAVLFTSATLFCLAAVYVSWELERPYLMYAWPSIVETG